MGGHLGIFSIADARRLARKRLPRMIFNYVDGAAGDEKAFTVLTIFLLKRPISPWG